MVEAQAEFDARAVPLCPEQLTAPLLHRVLAHPPVAPLVHGCKGVGSQVVPWGPLSFLIAEVAKECAAVSTALRPL